LHETFTSGPQDGAAMSRPRVLLAVLGLAFLVAGVAVSAGDRFLGIGFFIVGAFLFVLPFLAVHEEE